MKALSLTQPYASLIALGAKRIETRSFRVSYRGVLAIHASKRYPQEDKYRSLSAAFYPTFLAAGIDSPDELPAGMIVATCWLAATCPTEECRAISDQERAFGNYAPGRWAWLLSDIVALPEPIPAKGSLGLWTWDPPQSAIVQGRSIEATMGTLP